MLSDLLTRVESGSALALDQDPATHYLASAASSLIALGLRVSALETEATLAAQERVLTAERRDSLAAGLSAVQTELARARTDLQAAFSANTDARGALSETSREMIRRILAFLCFHLLAP